MKLKTLKNDLANEIVYWLSRPWALACLIAFCLIPTAKFAAALESGADFLNIPTDARGTAISANTASAQSPSGMFYNAAGLAGASKSAVSFMHAQWIEDGSFDSANVAVAGNKYTVGFSYSKFGYGEFQGRNADRSASRKFSAYDRSISVALGTTFSKTNFGIAVKHITSYAAGSGAHALAFDAGLIKAMGGLSLGFAVKNIGQGLEMESGKSPLPLSLNFGASAKILPQMALALDVQNLVRDGETKISVGTEYNLINSFAVRGGYALALNREARNLSDFSGGFGFSVADMILDYSFTPFADFGSTKRINLSCKF